MRFFELDLRNQCISLLVCYNFYWKISRCCSVYWDVDRGAVNRSIEESIGLGSSGSVDWFIDRWGCGGAFGGGGVVVSGFGRFLPIAVGISCCYS